MKIDLLHNKIIKDTVTSSFTDSFIENFVPKLAAKYGDSLLSVQMYEDYISDGFVEDNEFYYPLTLVFEDEIKREWIKWNVSNKKNFENGVPYAYVGEDYLDFHFADDVPFGFEEKLVGRGMYFEGGCVIFNIQSASPDKTFLAGKYSQTFIDEMTRQLTREIERAYSVSGLSESGVELTLVFAPGTYMEHVEENVTYRRLLITARGCSARDLWIKWTRNNGTVPLTVSDNITREEVTFELGEDVPHKVREKEYRFLVRSSSDKYQAAMGRKHITEWRDMMKRVIKRGELVKNEVAAVDHNNNELTFRLHEVLTGYTTPETVPDAEPQTEEKNDLAELLKGVLGVTDGEPLENEAPELDIFNGQYADEPLNEAEEVVESDDVVEEIASYDSFETEEEVAVLTEEALFEPEKEEIPKEDTYEADLLKIREDQLRRQIEAEIREKIALEAKVKAEEEALQLRRAHDELKAENERLAQIARRAEEERLASEAVRAAEAEKLRQEIEARERAEAREKERIAEAARLAVLEHQRLEAERAEEERHRKEEEERIREERARLEEEARAAEVRRIEEERIRTEMAARAAEEARAAEAAARAEVTAKADEDARIEAVAREAKAAVDKAAPSYNYTSKNARLLFRRPVDPNITKRIHEIILTTIKYFHKENVYIKIKATVPDSTTVNLHFVKIPEEETELLINIIKVLGKSDLGITKVFLE